MSRALILTNHLADISGSEIVASEVAEWFADAGFTTQLHCNVLSSPMAEVIEGIGISASEGPNFPNIFEFDIVWSQHHMLPLAMQGHDIPDIINTHIISVHLSPFEPFELVGVNLARVLQSTFVANSPETAEKLVSLGVPRERTLISYNAAPARFVQRSNNSSELRRLLVVSNHPPPEVIEAVSLLRQRGVKVKLMGYNGSYRRLAPDDIRSVDAVMCIGKTVQYSIVGSKPVYCYDHFGGPGWLTPENFERAEWFNFSGRDTPEKRHAQNLVAEIVTGYAPAVAFSRVLHAKVRCKYSLGSLLERLTEVRTQRHVAQAISLTLPQLLTQETANAQIFRRSTQAGKKQRLALTDLSERCERLVGELYQKEDTNRELAALAQGRLNQAVRAEQRATEIEAENNILKDELAHASEQLESCREELQERLNNTWRKRLIKLVGRV